MKKGIIVLLVAVLASSFAFAGFSGSAKVGFNFNFDSKDFGFSNSKATNVSLVLENDKIEVKGEADVYASIKASFDLKVAKVAAGANLNGAYALGVIANISEAKIYGDNWFVDITGAKGAYDYAKSPIDGSWTPGKDMFGNKSFAFGASWSATTYKAPVAAAPGITAGYDGWTVSGGILRNVTDATKTTGTNLSATIETKAFTFAEEAIKVQAAAAVGQTHVVAATDPTKKVPMAVGASLKASYAKDAISASAAADFGIEDVRNTPVFKFDTAVNFGYDFVTVGAYVAKTNALYISAQVAADLASFEVPATVTVTAKNLTATDKNIDLAIDATYDLETVSIAAGYSMNLKTKGMDVYASASYAAELFDVTVEADLAKVSSAADFTLSVGLGVSSTALIDGATLSLSYGYDADGYLANDFIGGTIGAIDLGCKIAF